MYKHVTRTLHILLLVIWLGTCSSSIYYINHESHTPPNFSGILAYMPESSDPAVCLQGLDCLDTNATSAATSTLTPMPGISSLSGTVPDAGWTLLQPGLERRVMPVYNDQDQQVESLYVWRLDQTYFQLDVAYDSTPKTLETWRRQTNALMVVNGGYYSVKNERYYPDGLTIVDGQASGRSFNGFGGMLAIDDSRAEIRWLVQKSYNAYEPLQAALQSFPILVEPGGVLGFGAERENHVSARRTVIGQDRDGRILFIVAPQGYFTLHRLSSYLTESDLDLDIALNLDGGGSTGILVASPPEVLPPTRPLPFVILVYAR